MSRTQIDVEIEELILHGFSPEEKWTIAKGLEVELLKLLGERGLPASWTTSAARIDAGSVFLGNRKSESIGAQIAKTILPQEAR